MTTEMNMPSQNFIDVGDQLQSVGEETCELDLPARRLTAKKILAAIKSRASAVDTADIEFLHGEVKRLSDLRNEILASGDINDTDKADSIAKLDLLIKSAKKQIKTLTDAMPMTVGKDYLSFILSAFFGKRFQVI